MKLTRRCKISFALLIVGTFYAMPPLAVSQTPATSTASLQDTLTWLTTFLPTATGAGLATASIASQNGCTVTIAFTNISNGTVAITQTFSLGDLDSTTVAVNANNGLLQVKMSTRGLQKVVKWIVGSQQSNVAGIAVGVFADQASAQRVANAFKHAVQLCANAQPF
jgi:hypothetical protein